MDGRRETIQPPRTIGGPRARAGGRAGGRMIAVARPPPPPPPFGIHNLCPLYSINVGKLKLYFPPIFIKIGPFLYSLIILRERVRFVSCN